jgi:hypothetical protein
MTGSDDTIKALRAALATQQKRTDKLEEELRAQRPSSAVAPTFKPPRPDFYDGERSATRLAGWYFSMQQAIEMRNIHGLQQVLFATAHLTKSAAIWWRMRCTKVEKRMLEPIASFVELETELKIEFEPVNSVKIARDQLAMLKQSGSVAKYVAQFRELVLVIPDISHAEMLDRFVRGLKRSVQLEVERREPSTLDEAIRWADRFDQVSFKSWTSYRDPRPSYPRPSYTNQQTSQQTKSPQYEPMDIDAISVQRKGARNAKKIRCYECQGYGLS